MSEMVTVIGAGSFGTALANLLASQRRVTLYARRPEAAQAMLESRMSADQTLADTVVPTHDLREACTSTKLIFITVPSENFREVIRQMAPHLTPAHIVIHGTKGLDLGTLAQDSSEQLPIVKPADITTMSMVIRQETTVLRVGCLAGPNLAREIAEGQPAGAVIASHFDEVIESGSKALHSDRFQVFESHDLLGAELCGVLKNIMAIGAGMLSGLGFGQNARSMLITKGLGEMIRVGTFLGAERNAFLGLAGVGDLMATCNSPLSRNFTVGRLMAEGLSLKEVLNQQNEVAEGIRTVRYIYALSKQHGIPAPITGVLHRILFENLPPIDGLNLLMQLPSGEDVDFI